MAEPQTFRIDLRAALPVAAFAVVVLVIIFIELCGRQDINDAPLLQSTPVTPNLTPVTDATPGEVVERPTATPAPASPEEQERDAQRARDLRAVQQALEQYFAENNTYPDTAGNVQTLCAFEEFDQGCALLEVAPDLPAVDPLGDPANNGYWYASTGSRYIVYAIRESELFPACEEHPDHLKEIESLMCVQGPGL